MILLGYDITTIIIATLVVTSVVLVLVVAYKRLLQYLSRGEVNREDFCVLHPLEENPASGMIEFYFTSEKERDYELIILDAEMQELQKVQQGKATPGGTIVRFDTTGLKDGSYFFCLKTSNQKTMKKMMVSNS